MKIVQTIEKHVTVSLDEHERELAFRAINKKFTGKELVPLTKKVSQEHKDAIYNVCISRSVEILVDIYEDGSRKYRMP